MGEPAGAPAAACRKPGRVRRVVRDARGGLFESALERARMRWTYEPGSSLTELAACYGFGLTKNHAMLDGNKRLGFLALGVFLRVNGYRLAADRVEAVVVMEDVAAGRLDERGLAAWLQTHVSRD